MSKVGKVKLSNDHGNYHEKNSCDESMLGIVVFLPVSGNCPEISSVQGRHQSNPETSHCMSYTGLRAVQ